MRINIYLLINIKYFLHTFKQTAKYMTSTRIPKLLLKKLFVFYIM